MKRYEKQREQNIVELKIQICIKIFSVVIVVFLVCGQFSNEFISQTKIKMVCFLSVCGNWKLLLFLFDVFEKKTQKK